MPRRVCVVITARASYARIKSALHAIQDHADLELQIVVGASALLERYGSVAEIIQEDGFVPNASVYMVLEGENLVTTAKSTGLGIVELATIFHNLRPDMVVSVADRYETIATAVAASYMNVPLVHVQGGEVTGSVDEKVRHAVTKLSNIHLVANLQSAERLVKMGEREDTIFVTGCPSIDLAKTVKERSNGQFNPFADYSGVGNEFDISAGYIVVMQHPSTIEYDQAYDQIIETMEAIDLVDRNAFFFWPNIDAGSNRISKGLRQYREFGRLNRVYFYKNLSPEDFVSLLIGSECIVGNSSAGIRECAFLGIPAVNIGTRQTRRDRAENVMDVNHDRKLIADAIEKQCNHGLYAASHLYGDGMASARIADSLATVDLRIDKTLTY